MEGRSFSSQYASPNNSLYFVVCFKFCQGLSHLFSFILTLFLREVGQ